MDWLSMLRGPPGRLTTVRRVSDTEVAARRADLAEHGDVICTGCGFQGSDTAYVRRGIFAWNPAAERFDVPSESGVIVYECPRCHLVDDLRHQSPSPQGIMHLAGWELAKGEWREHTCDSESCAGRGTPYVSLGCPGCGDFMFWHHASNGKPNAHGWQVSISGDVLTMSPSLLHGGCHFFIRENQVQWC